MTVQQTDGTKPTETEMIVIFRTQYMCQEYEKPNDNFRFTHSLPSGYFSCISSRTD